VSLSLRSGIDAEEVCNQLKGIRCPSPAWHNGSSILSCADAIGKALERHAGAMVSSEGENHISSLVDISPECPECGAILEPSEGCIVCRSCGYSQCT
jgi:ribonucleoside-diphosphate reductase alpha chain